jgi:Flp pilus assembly protein TadD
MNAPTDWVTALIILTAGVIVGVLFLIVTKRRKATLPADEDLRFDLEARRDVLLEQLRDPAVAGQERARLELEAADVLRRLDTTIAPATTRSEAAPITSGFFGPAVKGFLYGMGTFGVLAGAVYFVSTQATPRATAGEPAMAPAAATASVDPHAMPIRTDEALEDLVAKAKKEPANLDVHLQLAQAHLERDNLMAVFDETKIVLAARPDDSRALTLQAIVRATMGEGDRALEMLQRATKSDPKNLDARVALAWVLAQSGQMSEAERTMAGAAAMVPAEKAMLDGVMQQIRANIANAQRTAAQPKREMPAGHPPVGGDTGPSR